MTVAQVGADSEVGDPVLIAGELASELRSQNGQPYFLVKVSGRNDPPFGVYAKYVYAHDSTRGAYRRNDSDYTIARTPLSRNIRFFRQRTNLTQQALADAMGIDRSSVIRWEKGNRIPSLNNITRLSTALNTTTERLLSDTSYLQGAA